MRRRRRLVVTLAVAAVLALAATGLYRLVNSRTYQLAGTLVSRFDTPEKVVALTFDDGPDEHAAEVLAALAAEDVRATFYVVGSQMERFPKEAAALVAAGHELGNHTYTHRRMVFVSPDTVKDEVERTNALIRAAGQSGGITFRPPTGKKLLTLPMYLADHHQITVMWDVEPDSGKTPTAQEIVAEVRAEVRPGSIVLLHPWYGSGANTRAAIRGVVAALRAEGYSFVTVSEMTAGSQA
ncbi:polysaccharide deacetylase family protein [Nonomuraea roseoviolacea]|uniref:Peptidoglycan/xylan/chitin deacetylase (PgdA/CDA1 family) n=1 Tax=Nonomuraea roseoviolacea subsp. carminata TaxID=160689 RepID=A0ABT1KC12_9ACTN|nr:polysaccharide deacetylase family protein [Nonomuraea roseoviolacea]MCP2350524.1 peptidoglycan/xylan/chitin deacetylase (PgdA/CDA1 family) [Nonomuraea roseoviolacea subsp. carminata]